jgi:glycosyltransferase involved in cell wall biosynthesis
VPPVRPSWFSRAKEAIRALLLESPDSHVWWVPLAILRGARVLLTERVDVIYSSSPPHSSHLAAYVLARCFRKPHVVDFRDPWVTDAGLFQRWQAYAKRMVATNAARIVVVSPGEPDDLRSELPHVDAERLAVLTNGYDPDDFGAGGGAPADPRHFTITHAGTLYRETGQELFHALEQLIAADPQLRQALRVNLIGEIDSQHRPIVQRLEATGVIRSLGLQPHRATMAAVQESDVLLILQRGGTSAASHIPAKVFEYLFAAKPILAIAAPGALGELLTASGLGVTVAPHDVTGLANAIRALYRDHRSGNLCARPDMAYISRFDRRNLTARFADLLEETLHGA